MSRLTWRGAKVITGMALEVQQALMTSGLVLLEHANRSIPLDTGHMMRTGRVRRTRPDQVAITYDTPYAVRQHEDVRLRHARGRRARWLALTLEERQRWWMDYMKRAVGKGLG